MWGTFKKGNVALTACFCMLFFSNRHAVAQEERSPLQFGCMQQFGFAVEADRELPIINISNGIRWNRGKCYTGLGVGYEFSGNHYYAESLPDMLPAFVDARYYLFKKKWLYGLANAGVNFVIAGKGDRINTERFRRSYKNGMYGGLGAGVKARIGKEVFYTFDLSYNFKQSKNNREQPNHLDIWTTESVDIRQWRVILRMGIELFQ